MVLQRHERSLASRIKEGRTLLIFVWVRSASVYSTTLGELMLASGDGWPATYSKSANADGLAGISSSDIAGFGSISGESGLSFGPASGESGPYTSSGSCKGGVGVMSPDVEVFTRCICPSHKRISLGGVPSRAVIVKRITDCSHGP